MRNAIAEINAAHDVLLKSYTLDTLTIGLYDKNAKSEHSRLLSNEPVLEVQYHINPHSKFLCVVPKRTPIASAINYVDPILRRSKDKFIELQAGRFDYARGIEPHLLFIPFQMDERSDEWYEARSYFYDRHIFVHLSPEKYYDRGITPPDFIARDSDAARAMYFVKQNREFRDYQVWLDEMRRCVRDMHVVDERYEELMSDGIRMRVQLRFADGSELEIQALIISSGRRAGIVHSAELTVPTRAYMPPVYGMEYTTGWDINEPAFKTRSGFNERFVFGGYPYEYPRRKPVPERKGRVFIGPELGGKGWTEDKS